MTFRASFHFDIKPEWKEVVKNGRKTIDVRTNALLHTDVNKEDIIHMVYWHLK
jgi:ASC-1-like (ASCH) protein